MRVNKNGFTTDDIEEEAVRRVEKLCEHKLLKANISKNDKTLSWDGNIEIHKSAGKKKSTFFRKIEVQVKGKNNSKFYNKDEHNFQIERYDLINYRTEIGTLFICVITNDDATDYNLFYKMLFPEIIDDILEKSTAEKPSINLEKLKNNTKDGFYQILKDISIEIDLRHKNTIFNTINFDEGFFEKYDSLTLQISNNEIINGFAGKENKYIAKINISDIKDVKLLLKSNNCINIDGIEYYKQIFYTRNAKNPDLIEEVRFGHIFRYENNLLHIEILPEININDIYKDLSFLLKMVDKKGFYIDDKFYVQIIDTLDIKPYKKIYDDIEYLLNNLSIYGYFYQNLKYGYLDHDLSVIKSFNLFENNYLYHKFLSGHYYIFYKYKDKIELITNRNVAKVNEYEIPIWILKQNYLSLKYHDFENQNIIQNFQNNKIVINDYTFDSINRFLVMAMSCYLDTLNDKERSLYFEIIEYIINKISYKITKLSEHNNDLFNLNRTLWNFILKKPIEKDFLIELKGKYNNEFDFCCNVLLENLSNAKNDLNYIDIENFEDFPIYKLYLKMI